MKNPSESEDRPRHSQEEESASRLRLESLGQTMVELGESQGAGESSSLLRLVLDSMHSGVFWKDQSSTYMGCNQSFARMVGLSSPEDIVGRTDDELPWADEAERFRQADRQVIECGRAILDIEGPYTRLDGTQGWLRTSKLPLRDSEGRTVGVLGLDDDLTESRRQQEALQAIVEATFTNTGEDFFRALARHLAQALSVDMAFVGQLVPNKPWRVQTLGFWDRDHFLPGLEYDLEGTPCQLAMESGIHLVERGLVDLFPDDEHVVLLQAESYLGVPLYDSAGQRVGLVAIMNRLPLEDSESIRSILSIFAARAGAEIERKQVDEELRDARDALERRVRQRTEALVTAHEDLKSLLYIVSHDLRAPLINVKGFAGELQSNFEELRRFAMPRLQGLPEEEANKLRRVMEEDLPEALNFIDSSITRIHRFMDTLLRLSQEGQRQLLMEEVDTRAVVDEALRDLAFTLEQRQAKVEIGELPAVVADRLSMEQVFGNLLSNAALYLDPQRAGWVRVRGKRGEKEVVFEVKDNGLGISSEDLPKVFRPFRRGSHQHVEGEGMGLAYVQALVRRHGGRIWCQSEPGEGTTFYFTLAANIQSDDPRQTREIYLDEFNRLRT
ncbi:MAG: ATP-binding protein [Acidobacteriota bacterium]